MSGRCERLGGGEADTGTGAGDDGQWLGHLLLLLRSGYEFEKPSEAIALLVQVRPVLYPLEPAPMTGFRVVLERVVEELGSADRVAGIKRPGAR